MTSHTLYKTSNTWQHKRYICHLTHYIWHSIHCICVIKPSVSVIPHPLCGWHHTHSMYDIIFSMHGITWTTLYDITPLYVYHIHYKYDIISNIYDITHTVFMTIEHLHLKSHPLYLTSQPLYQCHHTCCIDDITSMEVITLDKRMASYTFYMKSHSQFMISMLSIHDITTTAFMTSDLLYMTSHPRFMTSHPLYLWHHTHSICVITPNISILSNPVYVWQHSHYICYHMHCIWHHIHSLWHQTTLFMTSSPLYLTSHPLYLTSGSLYLCHHTHSIDDITATICMNHIQYTWDILSTIFMTSYPLDTTTLCVDDTTLGLCMTSFALQKTSHSLYHTKPQYLWHHIHFRHDITPTVSLSSQPLHWYYTHFCMTSHPLSVWHHMHYI